MGAPLSRIADLTAPWADVVRRIFLMRQQRWPDRTPAHPVNLPPSSPLRERFSQAVLGQSTQELAPYWNDRYFHGTRPPPEPGLPGSGPPLRGPDAGGVGYVTGPAGRALPESVRVLFCLPAADDAAPGRDGTAPAPGRTREAPFSFSLSSSSQEPPMISLPLEPPSAPLLHPSVRTLRP